MSAGKVFIVGPDWRVPLETAADAETTLWYFGSDYVRFRTLAEAAQAAGMQVAPVGDAINSVARRIRKGMVELDAQLQTGKAPLAWTCSDFAERNPVTSDFYLNVCRAIALIEAARAGGGHVAVVEDRSLGKALARACRDASLPASATLAGAGAGLLCRGVKAHLSFLYHWAKRRLAMRHAGSPAQLKGRDVWLMSWLDGSESERSSRKTLEDRFLGPLARWLHDADTGFAWLVNAVWWGAPAQRIVEAARQPMGGPCVIADRFFGFRALVRAYAEYLRFPLSVRPGFSMAGLNLSALVRRQVWQEMSSARLVSAALYASLGAAVRRSDLKLRALVYTFENQPWEKGMLAGMRAELPNVRLIGVHHAPMAEHYLSGHPSRRQWSDGTAPDLLLTIGEEFRERLIGLGADPWRVAVGGTLRFQSKVGAASVGGEKSGKSMILISCPMDLSESLDLVSTAIEAAAPLSDVELVVNFHPMAEENFRRILIDYARQFLSGAQVRFVDGDAVKWLSSASVVLYNSSAVSFEACARGVPAVHVGSSTGLDLDKMSGRTGFSGRGADAIREQICRAIAAFKQGAMPPQALDYLKHSFAEPRPAFWIEQIRAA